MSSTVATTSNAIAVAPTAPQALGASVASPLMVETWADESWPLNSRQASEIITEQVLQGEHEIHHHATQSACSSVDQVTVQNSSTQGDTLTSATSPSETTTGGTLTYTPTTTLPNQSFGSVMIHQFSGEAEEELSAAAPANSTTTTSEPVTPTAVPHVRRCYTHDPYCIYTGLKLIAVCTCPTCVPRPAATMPQHVSPTEWNNEAPLDCYPETSTYTYPQPQEFHEYGNHGSDSSVQYPATSSGSSNWHKVSKPYTESTIKSMVSNNAPLKTLTSSDNFTPYPARLPPALQQIQQSKLLAEASRQQEESATAPAIPLPAPGTCMNNTSMTSFMPPAPPLLSKCHRVLQHESNAEEASAIISSMLVRWHGRVEKSQHQFLDRAEYCPTMETYDSLEDWSVACMDWWTHHFATKQMKYPPKKSSAKKSKKNKKAKKAKAAAAATAAKNASTSTKTASIAVGTADSSDDDEADQ